MTSHKKVKSTSKHLKDLLGGFEKQLQKLQTIPSEEILKFWPKIVGDNISKMTKAVEFKNETLFVRVNNSSLFSLLTLHEKKKLIQLLRSRFPTVKIKDIHFRLG